MLKAITIFTVLFWQSVVVPDMRIDVTSTRTSAYEYRDEKDGGRQFIEMRQSGKATWTRVEEIKCGRIGERWESQSFDFAYSCDFISPR